MFADSSSERATCSTIWLGDHFSGARGEVQALFVRSPAMINCSIASLLALRAVLISAMGPPFPEECPQVGPRLLRAGRECGQEWRSQQRPHRAFRAAISGHVMVPSVAQQLATS